MNTVTHIRKFKQQTKQQWAGVRGRRGGGWGKEQKKKEKKKKKKMMKWGRKNKKRESWRTWAGEMSAPQGGWPVLSTANRRGKHLQDKQSAHYLREHWHCTQQDTSLQKRQCSYMWKASFQNANPTFGWELSAPHLIMVLLGNVINLMVTCTPPPLFFFFSIGYTVCFLNAWCLVLEGIFVWMLPRKKCPKWLGLGIGWFNTNKIHLFKCQTLDFEKCPICFSRSQSCHRSSHCYTRTSGTL